MDIFHNILTSVMDDIAPPRSSRIYKNYYAFFHIIYILLVVKSVSSRKAHHGPGRGTRTEEDQRKARPTELGKRGGGGGTKWDLPERELTWAELWREDQLRISLLLRSVYDTLPSPVGSSRRPKL